MCGVCGCGQAEVVLEKGKAGAADGGRVMSTSTCTIMATGLGRTAIRMIIMTATARTADHAHDHDHAPDTITARTRRASARSG